MGLFDIFRRGTTRVDATKSEATRPSTVGLALGGGAVRGAAHIGVLSVLEEAGIEADVVAGTSVGSIIGAAYAAGVSSADMLELMHGVSWKDLTRPTFGSKYSFANTAPMARFIEQAIGATDFSDLGKPFAAVTCDVVTGNQVVIREGNVSRAVLASSAVPGVFPPVEDGEALYIDGGVVDLVPVTAVRDLGADYVIAVNIIPKRRGSHRPANAQELLLASFEIMQYVVERDAQSADVFIEPQVADFGLMDFSNVSELYERGRVAAQMVVEKLHSVLGVSAT